MNIIKVWRAFNKDYGFFYSNNESKAVNVFGLEGGRCTVMIKGQKKADKVFTVWLNDIDFEGDELPKEALYCHDLGALCRDKDEMELVCETYNEDLDTPVTFTYA